MQNIKKTLKSKRFWLGTVLPFALAVAAAFVARYQLEISDGATANYMAGQWPVYAPLNALTAFCLTLVVFALCGSWGIATGVSGLIFTVLALVNYYTRDLHGSAPDAAGHPEPGHRGRGDGQLYPAHYPDSYYHCAAVHPGAGGCRCAGQTGRQA